MKLHECGLYIPDFMEGPARYLSRAEICERATKFCKDFNVAIQAGGHIGIWPRMLSPKFRRVVTVEPEPKNLECLRANLSECNNVRIVAGVLDMVPGKAKLNYRETSSGGHHIMTRKDRPWIEVDMYQMDTLVDLQKERVGLIMLDIEGYELQALIGATAIIEKDHPVIVIEENGGAKKFGFRTDAARRWLMSEGYEVVDEFDEDLVMVWRPS